MQKPEGMAMFPPTLGDWFAYLMTFEDGNRIDLKLVPIMISWGLGIKASFSLSVGRAYKYLDKYVSEDL
jgi:hypothetical protein